jgi:hypothetical protein
MVGKHFHTLNAINNDRFSDTNKELINQFIMTNQKLDIMNDRLSSLETAEQHRNIHIKADVKSDPNGIIAGVKFHNYKQAYL